MGNVIGSWGALVALAMLPLVGWAQSADVDIETLTNGQDADTPPGPAVIVGSTVNWTYVVTNTGSRELANINVTDDQGVVVTCPGTTLDAGLSMTCTAAGTAVTGQYANIATVQAERTDTSIATDSDPSHYFGQAQVAITLEKRTNGVDADTPPGPVLAVGDAVSWTYEVTNVGSDPLSDIEVIDDQGVAVSCPGTDLDPSESMTCTANGTAQTGQYANIGSVFALLSPSEDEVAASDPSHYYGQTLLLETATNGQDADTPTGPVLPVGTAVNWTYAVTNPGPEAVTGLSVSDDQGVTVSCPQTTLASGESITCTASGVAVVGQYANIGTATAQLPLGGTVSASDPSHYIGTTLVLEKATNGQDADTAPGPVVAVGSPVAWTYVVTNNDPEALTNVEVVDDQGVVVTCPGTTLASGESMTCTGNGTAVAGQYANTGIVTADHPTLGEVGASDLSHYFGQDQVLDFGDAPAPYLTTVADNGARHILGSGVYLGACVDSELDGQPAAAADGDDGGSGVSTFGTCAVAGDDEDGATFTTALLIGEQSGMDVTANEACTLSAWLDANQDGDWGDAGEDLFPGGTALAAGVNPLSFTVPATAIAGQTTLRLRCTTDGAVAPAGEASDGEVEDYRVDVEAPSIVATATKTGVIATDVNNDGLAGRGDQLAYTIVVTNDGNVALTDLVITDTPDATTDLAVGTVVASQGTVTSGNTAGDTSVAVTLATLAPGDSVTVTFEVTLPDPPRGFPTQIVNQGSVSGSNLATVLTDDPSQPGAEDPTIIPAIGPVIDIPTLDRWSLAALAALLVLMTVAMRRRQAAGR